MNNDRAPALPVPEPQLAASGSVPPLSTVWTDSEELVALRRFLDDTMTEGTSNERGVARTARALLDKALAAVGAGAAELPEPRDAARYRLLRRGQHWSVIDGIGDTLQAETLDAAIDKIAAPLGAVAVDAAPQQNPDSVHQVGAPVGLSDASSHVSADARDAERYRWLAPRLFAADFAYGETNECVVVFHWPKSAWIGADLGAAIDAATTLHEPLPAPPAEAPKEQQP